MVHGDSIMKFLQNDNDTMAYFNKILSLNFLIFFYSLLITLQMMINWFVISQSKIKKA